MLTDPMDRPGDQLEAEHAWTRKDVADYIGDSTGSADRKLRAARRAGLVHRYRDANQVRYDEREIKRALQPRAKWRRDTRTTDGTGQGA